MKVHWPPRPLPLGPFGAFGTLLRPASVPPDASALFDFAAAGPTAGALASLVMLVAGLQATAAATPAEAAHFPCMSTHLLQSSFVVGNIVNAALPSLGLHASDLSTSVALHPMAYAGAVGLLLNALQCIPLGGTDGASLVEAVGPRVPHTPSELVGSFIKGAAVTTALVCAASLARTEFFGDATHLLGGYVQDKPDGIGQVLAPRGFPVCCHVILPSILVRVHWTFRVPSACRI
eukprot:TRINITY_DN5781_c0_g1_i9.p1 TRINITY_DN5781_c0_g1~~TRINITY_DN5781_c0_g1_i9.p1  ORF type:complete len:234 (-),score=11.69 TRINITY_DN5781_c0_g1_i9:1853-2554(-)